MRVRIRQGLDLQLSGAPEQVIHDGPVIRHVALCGADTVGLKPQMQVAEGDTVRAGQTLFVDKRNPAVKFTAPGRGTVVAVPRGARRTLQSVVIRLDDADECTRTIGSSHPGPHSGAEDGLSREAITRHLSGCGLWTAFRTRPFSLVPLAGSVPAAIFITATDTQPLAPDPIVVIQPELTAFEAGLRVLAKLTDGTLWLCTASRWNLGEPEVPRLRRATFDGPHPAGLAGTHMHRLDPVGEDRTAWHIGYQDVIAIGRLFTLGVLDQSRVVAIAGEPLARPRLVRTRLGASIDELMAGEYLPGGRVRVVSGSVLSGRAMPEGQGFLGRYHLQATALREGGRPRRFGWFRPGLAKLLSREPVTTALNGRPSGMLPLELFDRLLPGGFLANPLLRALMSGDIERARVLGCLELDEEDLALCAFACPAKCDYPGALRSVLLKIEGEG